MTTPGLALGDADEEVVREILRRHMPDREVWAFGSRVKGTSKPFSDLDLAVIGDEPLTLAVLSD